MHKNLELFEFDQAPVFAVSQLALLSFTHACWLAVVISLFAL